MAKTDFKTIEDYINTCEAEVQGILEKIRKVIREAVPEARETISYQMPAFWLHENLVYFAAFKHHISIFPTPSAIEAFQKELLSYKTSKGAVKFPIGQPIPYDLISAMARFRAEESLEKKRKK